MIRVSQLAKSFGARTLFENVTLELNPGARYGLVGANGSGKTTFLKILAGDEPASNGTVTIAKNARVGVLRQDLSMDDGELILRLAMMGDRPVFNLLEERARIIDHGQGDAAELADLEDKLSTSGGYTLEARAASVLEGLGIPRVSHPQPLATLSGGFKLRVLLAQVLLGGPDALLLDEPTNHLDILSIRWLEKFLGNYRGTAVVISHDQRFLDNVATHILDVDYATITAYPGNYAEFSTEKQAAYERKEAEIKRAEKIIAEKRAFVERFGAKATKAKQAQSRLKQIEKIEVQELVSSSRRTPLFRFTPERASGRDVLEVSGVSKAFGDKRVLENISLHVRRTDKLAVIGPNGLGKSTLLKIVTSRLPADRGSVRFGHEVRIGYFAQDHHELLQDERMTPLEYVWQACPSEPSSFVRGQLGRVLFSGSDVEKPVGALSGGEAARLIFCRIIVEKPNVLILDEPTNHLDLEAIGALISGLNAFEGTVIFVSHDRFFVSELATRVLEITPDGPRDFPGTYAEYLERCGDDHLDADAVVLKDKTQKAALRQNDTSKEAWAEQKKRKNRLNALPARRDKLLSLIEDGERREQALLARYAEPGFFERTERSELSRLEREQGELKAQIASWMSEWEAVEAELAEAGEAEGSA
ncbi:MAG TPA: ABC-F family ATP-binding cassette domain-containing protein [Polyangiaceae bacterium]